MRQAYRGRAVPGNALQYMKHLFESFKFFGVLEQGRFRIGMTPDNGGKQEIRVSNQTQSIDAVAILKRPEHAQDELCDFRFGSGAVTVQQDGAVEQIRKLGLILANGRGEQGDGVQIDQKTFIPAFPIALRSSAMRDSVLNQRRVARTEKKGAIVEMKLKASLVYVENFKERMPMKRHVVAGVCFLHSIEKTGKVLASEHLTLGIIKVTHGGITPFLSSIITWPFFPNQPSNVEKSQYFTVSAEKTTSKHS